MSRVAIRRTVQEGIHAIDCEQLFDDEPRRSVALAAGEVRAANIDASSAVDAVTVYPDGASVTRVVTLDLSAGENSAVLKDFPLTLDPSSLRVEGEAGAKLTIGAIDARPPRAAPPVNLPELDKRIEALKDERANLQGAINAATARRKFAERFAEASPAGIGEKGEARPIAEWRAAFAAVAEEVASTEAAIRDAGRKQRELDREIARARTGPRAEAAEQTGSPDRSRRRGRNQSHARVTYCGAQRPLDTALRRPPRHRRQGPQARARTGAPRRNHPKHRRGLVQCRAQRLDRANRARRQRAGFEFARSCSTRNRRVLSRSVIGGIAWIDARPLRRSALARRKPRSPSMRKRADEQQATAEVGGFQVMFKIPGRVSVGASEGAKSLRVSTATLAPDLAVRAAPVMDPTAFLEASFRQNEDAPLLPGRVAIYRDGVFVGRGLMAAAGKDETVRLGFGADDKVKIERSVLKRNEGTAGLIVTTSKTDERAFKTTVRNGHDFPIRIAIEDQLPVSENEDIVVEMLPSTTAPTASNIRDKRGVLEWAFEAKAGEVRDINFAWRVRWPKDKSVVMTPSG